MSRLASDLKPEKKENLQRLEELPKRARAHLSPSRSLLLPKKKKRRWRSSSYPPLVKLMRCDDVWSSRDLKRKVA